jgi:hypothetical protein
MLDYCNIEKILEKRLINENKRTLFANYESARIFLFNYIYPEIKSKLPDYTYHDGSHVINVLENVLALLDENLEKITSEVLYFICLSVLFHDAGLIYGRENHQKNISDIYTRIRGSDNLQTFANEKLIITNTVEAHTGHAPDDTKDTIKCLGDNNMGYNEIINTKKIAAIIKFADELAEGGQRTSDYFIENNIYKKNSKIFHRYSQAYKSIISSKDNRIAISYNIFLRMNNQNTLVVDQDIELKIFLEFIYERLIKIDDERKYCRYYCPWLESMKEISVIFNFWYKDERIECGLSPIIFSDKIIPGESNRIFEKSFPDYTYSKIIEILIKQINDVSSEVRYESTN